MDEPESPPPRPIRPPNYVVTEFTDQSGKPKMPPRPNDSPITSQSEKKTPPPVPSYRSHVANKPSSDKPKSESESNPSNGHSEGTSQESPQPVAPPRKSRAKEKKEDTTPNDVDSASDNSHTSGPSRPHPPKPNTPSNKTLPAEKQKSAEKSPPTPKSSTMKSPPASTPPETKTGFSGFFRKKSAKKPKPVITVVDAKPITSKSTVSSVTDSPSPVSPGADMKEDPNTKQPTKPVRPASKPARPVPVKPTPFTSKTVEGEKKGEDHPSPSPQPRTKVPPKSAGDSTGVDPVPSKEPAKPVPVVRKQVSVDSLSSPASSGPPSSGPSSSGPPSSGPTSTGPPSSSSTSSGPPTRNPVSASTEESTESSKDHIYAVPKKPARRVLTPTSQPPDDDSLKSKSPEHPTGNKEAPQPSPRPLPTPPTEGKVTPPPSKPKPPSVPRPRAATVGHKPRPQPVAGPRMPTQGAVKEKTSEGEDNLSTVLVGQTGAETMTKDKQLKKDTDECQDKPVEKEKRPKATPPSKPMPPTLPRSRSSAEVVGPHTSKPTAATRELPGDVCVEPVKPSAGETPKPVGSPVDHPPKNKPPPQSRPKPPVPRSSSVTKIKSETVPKEGDGVEGVQDIKDVKEPGSAEQPSTPSQPQVAKRQASVKRPPKPLPPSPRKNPAAVEKLDVSAPREEQKEKLSSEDTQESVSSKDSGPMPSRDQKDTPSVEAVEENKKESTVAETIHNQGPSEGKKPPPASSLSTVEETSKEEKPGEPEKKVPPAKPRPPPPTHPRTSTLGRKPPTTPGVGDSGEDKDVKSPVMKDSGTSYRKEPDPSENTPPASKPLVARRPPSVKRPAAPTKKPTEPPQMAQVGKEESEDLKNKEETTRKEPLQASTAESTVSSETEVPLAEKKTEVPLAEKKTEVPLTEKKTEVHLAEKKTEVPLAEKKTEVPLTEKKTEVHLAEKKTGEDLPTQQKPNRPVKPRPPPPKAKAKVGAPPKPGVESSSVKANDVIKDKETEEGKEVDVANEEDHKPAPTLPLQSGEDQETKGKVPKKPPPKPSRPPARPKPAEKPVSVGPQEMRKPAGEVNKDTESEPAMTPDAGKKEETRTKEVVGRDEKEVSSTEAVQRGVTLVGGVGMDVAGADKEDNEGEKRSIAAVGEEEVSEVDRKEVPEVDRKVVPKVDKKELPEVDRKEVPEVDRKEVPEVDKKEVPEVDRKEVPELDRKEVPEVDQKKVVEENRKEVPEVDQKEVVEVDRSKQTLEPVKGVEGTKPRRPAGGRPPPPGRPKAPQTTNSRGSLSQEELVSPSEKPPPPNSVDEITVEDPSQQADQEGSSQKPDSQEISEELHSKEVALDQLQEGLPEVETGDVITTPTGSSTQSGKPSKPPPPAQRPPPPSRKSKPTNPPPPKKPGPPRKGPPPHKPVKPSSNRDPNSPPPLPPRPTLGHPFYHYVTTEPRGVAKYNYTGETPGELSFDEGDVLELISREGIHWFLARNVMDPTYLHEGLVNERHLRIIKKLPEETQQSTGEEGPCAIAMYDFKALNFGELSLKNGDLVYLESRVDKEWLRGHTPSGNSGIFPVSMVEIVEDLPEGPMECELVATPTITGPSCRAEFAFKPEGPGELGIQPGDVIELLERVDGEWLKGRLAGVEGIFPADFVTILEDLPPVPEPPKPQPSKPSGNTVTAVFDFEGMEGELTFKTGAKIVVTAKVNEEWLEGSCGAKKGRFPSSFVDRVPDNLPAAAKEEPKKPEPKSEPAKKTGKCKVLFKFETDIDGELPLKEGDVVETLSWISDEWMTGRVGNKEGMFPVSFVEVVVPLPRAVAEPSKHHHKVATDDDLMPKGLVLYDHAPRNQEEISVKAGEVVLLLEKVGDNRFNGENSEGQIGYFPTNIIDVIVPLP